MKGAFQTSREIFENPIWNDIPKFRIFFYIYGNAVFAKEGTTVAGMHLKRGQYLRSFRNLQEDLTFVENRSVKKYSLSVIKNKVDQLVKENRLKIEGTELGTLFTVVNYESYQGFDNYKKQNLERSENGERTQSERSENNNKNVNKDKNVAAEENPFKVYEENFGVLKPILREQFIDWCDEVGNDIMNAAMKLAAKKGGRTFGYIEEILKEWSSLNLTTLEDVRAHEVEKMNRKDNVRQFKPRQPSKQEVDWKNI
ncbi:DnaD domain-containing protein [Microbulbifer pacificus]|uniref:DnaD domain-containing protein n=1 Tax=Microbulbifer pacificus TaxID=407164 RepID=UPI000CF401EC|nr:DnaD domain protein [Microbulbifer pacificus]